MCGVCGGVAPPVVGEREDDVGSHIRRVVARAGMTARASRSLRATRRTRLHTFDGTRYASSACARRAPPTRTPRSTRTRARLCPGCEHEKRRARYATYTHARIACVRPRPPARRPRPTTTARTAWLVSMSHDSPAQALAAHHEVFLGWQKPSKTLPSSLSSTTVSAFLLRTCFFQWQEQPRRRFFRSGRSSL